MMDYTSRHIRLAAKEGFVEPLSAILLVEPLTVFRVRILTCPNFQYFLGITPPHLTQRPFSLFHFNHEQTFIQVSWLPHLDNRKKDEEYLVQSVHLNGWA
ncbi:unnamed protein product [Mesocestoides corti]|uniref:Uncharacterized protein n=2 Tax=Mesocestoides corti TaxID=53468 RepID=A0A0R3UQP4_MESCO|nr:unnamed protein product [Mesocestoides corti]